MIDNLGRDDTAYHEYLQRRAYAEDLGLNSPTLPLIILEPDPDDTPWPQFDKPVRKYALY